MSLRELPEHPLLKICGLSTVETLDAAISAGASMVGLVVHPASPRAVTVAQAAALAAHARARSAFVSIVALVVDPIDDLLDALMLAVEPDWFQLHGSEPGERVIQVKARTGRRVLKAMGIAKASDLATLPIFRAVADLVLLDAKPPADATYPGGHGTPFDWSILRVVDASTPFLLSGGLTPDNVAAAIKQVRPTGVDVSSGVESARGVKDEALIRRFLDAAREGYRAPPASRATRGTGVPQVWE